MRSFAKVFLSVLLLCFMTSQAGAAEITYKKGDSGKAIRMFQEKLIDLGYPIYKSSGLFDAGTYFAVKSFQREHKLKITGIVDKKTYNQIMKSKAVSEGKSDIVSKIIYTASKYKGVPYLFGGATPKAFDCSGFVQYVFKQNGINLPRTADVQFLVGRKVNLKDLRAGDLVFFSTYEKGASHSGIYTGKGQFISATSSKGVTNSPMSMAYWKTRYVGAKRVI